MLLYIYDRQMTLLGVVEKLTSFIWVRRYWSVGEFKLLVPFTETHGKILQKNNLIMRQVQNSEKIEVAEILYTHISQNQEGKEEIEVQGRFITRWIGKRIIKNQIITKDTTPNIINRIVLENITNPTDPARRIPEIELAAAQEIERDAIDYTSEPFINALTGIEEAAKASKLGYRVYTDIKSKKHYFEVYDGRDLTADQTENPPCIFSKEFDNVVEQEYTNSIENLKSMAYVGGENRQEEPREVVEVGAEMAGLDREEIFVNAVDITKTYTDDQGQEQILTDEEYTAMLNQRGVQELEQYAETLSFNSSIYTYGNLKYREDYDVGDRVTCLNKKWGIKINVRITEVSEIYQQDGESLEITFGESLPALMDKIRQAMKRG